MTRILHGGAIAAAARIYGGEPGDWLDLSTGINPNPPALADIPTHIWNRLPDADLIERARTAARGWYLRGIPIDSTSGALPLPVPGTQALIQILPRLAPADRPIAILSPTYGEYGLCFRRAGFRVDEIADLADLRPDHGLVIVVNPNNPTGRLHDCDDLRGLARRLEASGARLHVDEAFGDSHPEATLAGFAATTANVTVSRSFGKFFGLAGVRLGFVFAQLSTLDFIETELGPWAVSGPALHLAAELMSGDASRVAQGIAARSAALAAVLDDAGLKRVGSTDLFQTVAHENAAALFEHLARSHILVRKFDYAADWLRVGLAPDEEGDRRLAQALASFEG
ncbi:cobalamin biosynthetic protein CobC [Rhizobium sp. SG_E_25_P2]|uniref:threonine-phosphate decarboxylase CobD n=1 Tax=Rhizobium sp. SG_E_25_P2 TaxID=2879942 RepID=UPI002475BA7B|nr:threonine-phosphate decarboxylase CobD [Rhizobium sp. SG_E_25_P2]MDH6267278.1 cobalamin biosynthetic protein CobC [Rhizobium sp. SG_E_25_P2]